MRNIKSSPGFFFFFLTLHAALADAHFLLSSFIAHTSRFIYVPIRFYISVMLYLGAFYAGKSDQRKFRGVIRLK